MGKNYIYLIAAIIFIALVPIRAKATTITPIQEEEEEIQVTVGQDEDGNVTVTYDDHVFIRKYNGWYIPSAYIYDGSELANLLDKKVANTRRTSVRYDGFLFIRMSGGWYRHELHFNDGRALANVFNKAAGITSTYYKDQEVNGQPEAGQ
ncbi:MAG: hypothetical protein E7302_06455 [Butyrivibrio sp.]|nr:hypothetical protein [Butyrivibrio sp.]